MRLQVKVEAVRMDDVSVDDGAGGQIAGAIHVSRRGREEANVVSLHADNVRQFDVGRWVDCSNGILDRSCLHPTAHLPLTFGDAISEHDNRLRICIIECFALTKVELRSNEITFELFR